MTHNWIVARTRPNAEGYAAFHIKRGGYEYYLPMARDVERDRTVPLFRSYIFVRTWNGQFYDLLTTYGVTSVVRQGDAPSICPDRIIDTLQRLETDGVVQLIKPRLKPGTRVRVRDGALVGRLGLLLSTCERDRARVLMTILGRGTTISLKYSSLEAA